VWSKELISMGTCCHRTGKSRVIEVIRWAVPGAILALIPKCPLCFAAYLALIGGIGLSLPVAAVVQKALVALCVASLFVLTYRRIRNFVARRSMRS